MASPIAAAVTADAQGVAVNVDVLHVDGGGESFERVVIETVQRGHEAQIFGNSLRDGLGERVILHGERDVAAQEFERVEFAVFIECVAGAAAEGDHAGETTCGFQRG